MIDRSRTDPQPSELVVRPPLSPDAAQHPLAHYDGLTCLLQALPAYMVWGDCTPRMRDTLRALWADLDQQARAATHGTPLVLPALPAGTHPRTAAALTRLGLVCDGHLTPLGGLAVYWCARPDTAREA